MSKGTPIQRQFILVSNAGNIVIDWGNREYQDVFTGEKLFFEKEYFLNPVQEADLEYLKKAGIVLDIDNQQVYFSNLPQSISKK